MSRKKRKSTSPHERFMRRTHSIYRHQLARAGHTLDYALSDLRALCRDALTRPCADCGRPLTPANLSVDHINPVARQGEHAYGNLRVVCMACNSAKGPLTIAEWDDLLELLASWPAPIAANTLARLRAGGRQARLQMRDPSVRPGP